MTKQQAAAIEQKIGEIQAALDWLIVQIDDLQLADLDYSVGHAQTAVADLRWTFTTECAVEEDE